MNNLLFHSCGAHIAKTWRCVSWCFVNYNLNFLQQPLRRNWGRRITFPFNFLKEKFLDRNLFQQFLCWRWMQRNNLESSYKTVHYLWFYMEHPYCYGQLEHFSTSTPFSGFPGVFRFLPKHWSWLGSYPYFKSNHTPRRSCSHKGGSGMCAWQCEKRESGQWNWIFGIHLKFYLKLTVKF